MNTHQPLRIPEAPAPAPSLEGFTLMRQGSTFMDLIGPVWLSATPAGAVVLLEIGQQHTNPNGSVHGGVLMALLDVALGSSLEAALQTGSADGHGHPITMQLSCNMVGAARRGEWVRVDATVDRLARSVGFSSGRITVGERLVMTGSAVFKTPAPPKAAPAA